MLPELTARVVTPGDAQRLLLLTRAAGCRADPVDVDHARRLAGDMTRGDWNDANPVPLALCPHGAVIRGVHRLHAVVISQVPRNFLIARGVPHQVRHLPGAKARTAADALGVVGVVSHRKEIAAAVHLLELYGTERSTLPWPAWGKRVFTNIETVRLFQTRFQDLPGFLPVMNALRSGLGCTPPASLAVAYLIAQASAAFPSAAADFFQGLIVESWPGPLDPRRDVHAWFMARGTSPRGRVASAQQLGLIITCWNLWAVGGTRGETPFGPEDPMPDIRRISAAPAS
ncbi:hypothetical protein [Streptomyces sp. NPDC051546]|uniref:hypothetical protein n=1 Tax=Streptomyces sp. NPDC051546 TaxID=3365655 RepID=UPI00379C8A17